MGAVPALDFNSFSTLGLQARRYTHQFSTSFSRVFERFYRVSNAAWFSSSVEALHPVEQIPFGCVEILLSMQQKTYLRFDCVNYWLEQAGSASLCPDALTNSLNLFSGNQNVSTASMRVCGLFFKALPRSRKLNIPFTLCDAMPSAANQNVFGEFVLDTDIVNDTLVHTFMHSVNITQPGCVLSNTTGMLNITNATQATGMMNLTNATDAIGMLNLTNATVSWMNLTNATNVTIPWMNLTNATNATIPWMNITKPYPVDPLTQGHGDVGEIVGVTLGALVLVIFAAYVFHKRYSAKAGKHEAITSSSGGSTYGSTDNRNTDGTGPRSPLLGHGYQGNL